MSNKKWVFDNTNNRRNMAVLKTLKDICPKYANHMFDHNRIVEAFFMSDKGGINPFSMPICGSCNKPGTRIEDPAFMKLPHQYDKDGKLADRINCYCEVHGITYNTKDLRSFLIEDEKIPMEAIMQLELLLYGGNLQ
jgi:hypothetical protein